MSEKTNGVAKDSEQAPESNDHIPDSSNLKQGNNKSDNAPADNNYPLTTDFNILITSISGKVPLLEAVKRASRKLDNQGQVFGGDTNCNCTGRYFVDKFWHMPCIKELELNDLTAYCRQHNIRCIIPTRDGDLPFLARHRKALAAAGVRVMVSDEQGINTCLDKLAFYKQLKILGFPVITTTDRIEGLNDFQKAGGSYVVKERWGAGSEDILLDLGREEASDRSIPMQSPVFQPFIRGREVSADLYAEQAGTIKGVITRHRKLVVEGESQITCSFRNGPLEDLCRELAEKLNLYGHIVLQVLIDDNNDFHIIEGNARFGGASTLSLALGLDSFYWFFLESCGRNLDDYPFIRSEQEKKLVRYACDKIF